MGIGTRFGKTDPKILATRNIGSLDDEALVVRIEACEALALRNDRSAVPALVRTLREDQSDGVRYAAAQALEMLGDIQALPALVDDYYRRGRYGRIVAAGRVEDTAVNACAHDGNAVVAFLVEHLYAKGLLLRGAVRRALGEIGDRAAVDPLAEAMGRDDWLTRRLTFHALAKIGGSEALPALRKDVDRSLWRKRRIHRELDRLEAEGRFRPVE